MAKRKSVASLDANVVLRYLLADVPEQTRRAEAIFSTATKLHIADAVLAEVVFVLEKIYKLERDIVVLNIKTIVNHPVCNCNRPLFGLALELYLTKPQLSIVDCMALGYARLNNATPLYTFDAVLIKKTAGDAVAP